MLNSQEVAQREREQLQSYVVKYRVIDREFDDQIAAENYARLMTNSVSSKVWISRIIYANGRSACFGSYTL